MTLRKVGELPDFDGWQTKDKRGCYHPEHNPPTHIVLEPGIYEHTCPGCSRKIEFSVQPTWNVR